MNPEVQAKGAQPYRVITGVADATLTAFCRGISPFRRACPFLNFTEGKRLLEYLNAKLFGPPVLFRKIAGHQRKVPYLAPFVRLPFQKIESRHEGHVQITTINGGDYFARKAPSPDEKLAGVPGGAARTY